MTGNMLDYTAHMYSSQDQTSVKRRQAKRQGKAHALHPPWLVLPDQVSEPPCKRRERDTEALRHPGGGVPGGRSHRHRSQNTVCFTFYVAAVVKPPFPFFPFPHCFS